MAKELVLYFSVYGTAKNVAEEIAKQTGADIREIVPAVPYDGNRDHYPALLRVAQKEHDTDARPAIKEALPIGDYDRIYLGYRWTALLKAFLPAEDGLARKADRAAAQKMDPDRLHAPFSPPGSLCDLILSSRTETCQAGAREEGRKRKDASRTCRNGAKVI